MKRRLRSFAIASASGLGRSVSWVAPHRVGNGSRRTASRRKICGEGWKRRLEPRHAGRDHERPRALLRRVQHAAGDLSRPCAAGAGHPDPDRDECGGGDEPALRSRRHRGRGRPYQSDGRQPTDRPQRRFVGAPVPGHGGAVRPLSQRARPRRRACGADPPPRGRSRRGCRAESRDARGVPLPPVGGRRPREHVADPGGDRGRPRRDAPPGICRRDRSLSPGRPRAGRHPENSGQCREGRAGPYAPRHPHHRPASRAGRTRMIAKTGRFLPFSTKLDFPASEGKVLELWKEIRAFEEGLKRREGAPPYIFYEGPPTANGLPGVHHVISRTVKDVVCRYKAMRGHYVPRKGGWDTHGLPVEIEVERELKISGKDQIEKFGIAEFNARCRQSVLRYENEWRRNTERIGFWLDMDHPYVTFSNEYIETVWWLLKQIWDKGLLYQGHKIVPYCPRCGTPLSSHEVSQGYEDVTEPSVTVKFELVDEPGSFVLAWTTTPWTLPGNVALAVGADVDYVRVRQTVGGKEERYYIARDRVSQLEGEYAVERELKGRELVGKRYRPLFDFINLERVTGKKAYYIADADFVTTEDGTGVVHTAVMYGEDDYVLGQRLDLPQHHMVDPQGRFTAEVTPWAGKFVKDAEPEIRKWLKSHGALYREEMTTHSYPFCWRCDTPLLYYAWKTWYIATTRYRDQLLAAHKTVEWHPEDIGASRFGNWLESNVDWALSRNRYWGTPLNLWRCEACGADRCVGSVAELRQGKGLPEPLDLHRPFVDQVVFTCEKCGGQQRRVPEVIDVWFDSGSMPYAQWHYPFENEKEFERSFPADFVSEGMDQTRGWFYTLMAIAVAVSGRAPYRHVLPIELILDKQGKKMSKTRGNTVDPNAILDQRGADALRFYLISVSPPWMPTRFDPEGVTEVTKKLLGTLRNVAQFFALYANIDSYDPAKKEPSTPTLLDRWILSRLHTLTASCRAALDEYDLTRGARLIQEFVLEELSNWYVRRSRRRFWKSGDPADKRAAYDALWECLRAVSRLLAPYVPFLSEELHQHLVLPASPGEPRSIHWCDYPEADRAKIDEGLERSMELALRVVNMARAARSASSLRVRQPLRRLAI